MKKTVIFLICICIFLVGCNSNKKDLDTTSSEISELSDSLIIPKITSDSLNPYKVTTNTNKHLLSLCFDGLFSVNSSFKATNAIAESYTVDNNKFIITLKSDAVFSDNSPVTAADVVFSYNLAKAQDSPYLQRFNYITSAIAKNSKVEITFISSALSNLNLLDIPIIKSGTQNEAIPIGCGKYTFSQNDDGNYILNANSSYYGTKSYINQIKIVEVPDYDTMFHSFNSGQITACYADLLNVSKSYLGTINLNTFTTNNMFFLSFNMYNPIFANAKVRQAISMSINRQKIASETLLSYAVPVWHPFNPSYFELSGTDIPSDIYSLQTALVTLDETELVLNGETRCQPLNLLVNSNNSYKLNCAKRIKEDLSGIGIPVNVIALTGQDYDLSLSSLNFDLFLGEVRLPANMDISIFSSPQINVFGWDNTVFQNIQSSLNSSEYSYDTAVTVFFENSPFIPICFKKAALAATKSLTDDVNPSDSSIFYSIENAKLE